VEGGIFATRMGVASGGASESSIAWQEVTPFPPGWKPDSTSAKED